MKRLASALCACVALALPVKTDAHVKGCHTRACDRRISRERHRTYWIRRFHALPVRGQRWGRCVSFRESRNQRVARASGFLSYFQWTSPTWHSAGGTGNPETHSWFEQAVKAWRWHVSHPYGQWPNTGERGICGG